MTDPGQRHGLTLMDMATLLARHRGRFVAMPLLVAALALGLALILPPTYTATAVFVPEAPANSRLPSAIAGLVGQLGLPLDVDAARSPRFYADVLKSRALLERALLTRYADPRGAGADSASLLDILAVR